MWVVFFLRSDCKTAPQMDHIDKQRKEEGEVNRCAGINSVSVSTSNQSQKQTCF